MVVASAAAWQYAVGKRGTHMKMPEWALTQGRCHVEKRRASTVLLGTAIFALTINALPTLAFGQDKTRVILTDEGPKEVVITPFMADEIRENTRILLDGNRVVNKGLVKVYRDSEGRMRREEHRINAQGVPEDAPTLIYIDDPVAGVFYTLNPRTRTAHKMKREAAIDFSSRRTSTRQQPSASRGADGREYRSEPLGSQEIEGFNTEGVRTTEVIPAGVQGNEQPLEIVNEQWVSPDLHITLLRKHDDPFAGQTLTRVTNIRLEEPPPDLFQVPADYAIEEARPPARDPQTKPANE
jgi:hypothetical protein